MVSGELVDAVLLADRLALADGDAVGLAEIVLGDGDVVIESL